MYIMNNIKIKHQSLRIRYWILTLHNRIEHARRIQYARAFLHVHRQKLRLYPYIRMCVYTFRFTHNSSKLFTKLLNCNAHLSIEHIIIISVLLLLMLLLLVICTHTAAHAPQIETSKFSQRHRRIAVRVHIIITHQK